MNPSIQLFLHFLAGITIAFASIYLFLGLQKKGEKVYLFFGLIGFGVGIYYLLFPYYSNPWGNHLIFKIGFLSFLSNFALLPWFLCYFTKYCKKKIQWALTGLMAMAYMVFLISPSNGIALPEFILSYLSLSSTIVFGFVASRFQYKQGDKNSAVLLIVALSILALLGLDDILRMQFSNIYPIKLPKGVLPLDYFLVLFMILIGIRLIQDMRKKNLLEESYKMQERRWQNLLEKVELIVIGLNKDGSINYANPYFEDLTGYSKEEVIGEDFMDKIIPEQEQSKVKKAFQKLISRNSLTHFQNAIKAKNNQVFYIDWSNVIIENESGEVLSTLSIGNNISERKKAFKEIEELKSKLENENILLKAEFAQIPKMNKIVGNSDPIQYVLKRAFEVAPTNTSVILEGETGVGKEVIANYIHLNSKRKNKAYVKINCAAIPASLLESEMFGHVKGAFTGAEKTKKGMVELADGGTLLLDEIGEFPMELQSKLLRFLQEGEYLPLGAEKTKKVDVRIITSTNRDLLKGIENKSFRNDLYYRLYVYPITIPPLRNRIEDIPEFVDAFIKIYSQKNNKKISKVSKRVIDELIRYSWPGNVRELQNVIERAVIICRSDTIKIKDISNFITDQSKSELTNDHAILSLEDMERSHIINVLDQCQWKIHGSGGAAELLNINPSTLRSRIKKLNIIKSNEAVSK
jgi:PAS domain S-box-containing protein